MECLCSVLCTNEIGLTSALSEGNDTRYVNASHGLDAPTNAAYLTVMGPSGVPHSFLVATSAIKQGQEILTDYGELSTMTWRPCLRNSSCICLACMADKLVAHVRPCCLRTGCWCAGDKYFVPARDSCFDALRALVVGEAAAPSAAPLMTL